MSELGPVPLATRAPNRPDWKRRCKMLEDAARQLLTSASLSSSQRAALFGDLALSDIERQIVLAYRSLNDRDRQAVRTVLERFSAIDIARKDRREQLVAVRRSRMQSATKGEATS